MLRWAVPLLLLIGLARGEVATLPLPLNCPSSQVFDPSGLICVSCDAGLVPVQDEGVCGCAANSHQTNVECTIDSLRQGSCVGVECSSECSESSQAPSLDKSVCVPCSNSAFDAATNQCTCNNPAKGSPSGTPVVTQRIVEIHDAAGQPLHKDCFTCPEGTAVITEKLYADGQQYFATAGRKYTADPSTCASCPDPHMFFDTDYSCVCEDGYLVTGEASVGEQSCLKNRPSVAGSYSRVRFQSLDVGDESMKPYDFTLDSITFAHLYMRAAGDCDHFHKDSTRSAQSCEALGNLCVMSMYDEDVPACRQLDTISQRRTETYHGQEEWKVTLPWLRYGDDAETIVNDRGIKMKASFHPEDDRTNILRFKLAKYAVNGTYLGMEDLTNQLEYCFNLGGNDDQNHAHWLTFGNTYRHEYSCAMERLLEKEMFLYDMYLVDEGSDSCGGSQEHLDCLYPVPVLNRNLAFPNVSSRNGELDDAYTRRFFLFDNQSGRTTSGVEAVRYAKKIVLQIPTRSENPEELYPPQLIVEYATATKSDTDETFVVFKAEYSMRSDSFWEDLQIWLGFIFAFAVVIFGVRMNNYQSRQRTDNDEVAGSSIFGLQLMLHAFVVACHTIVLLFSAFLFVICAYWFLFFKLQRELFMLLPPESEFHGVTSEYLFFEVSFRLMFWCQTIYIGYTIMRQCRSDIIFVDHERIPRGKASTGTPMWRLVTVANEFNRMQAKRRSSIEFSLVLVAFFMLGLGQHNNALPQPNFDQGQGQVNIALSFANTVLFWALASIVQWLWRVLVFERFIGESPAEKITDICTVCNISVFIMIENNKGWYLHGVSPFQTADCSMEEMLTNLEREGLGHFIERGFNEATGDCQTFDFFASPVFRRQLSKIYGYALPTHDRSASQRGDNTGGKDADKSLARAELTRFLREFVDQQPSQASTNGLSYLVRESLLVERLGGTPAEFRNAEPKCILHPDNHGFLSATFLGIEMDLLLHDILTYNVANLAFGNAGISIFLCYAMHLLRFSLRSWWGSRNLAAKSLIDAKFLGISQ